MRHDVIALVGMPGAGKTTVGALLAEPLALPFRDSDAEIERATGTTVAALFAGEGEVSFRARERAAIVSLLDSGPLVLATGGGAMAEPGTQAVLLARAVTIWLDAPVATLARRLHGQTHRPLLTGDVTAQLTALLATRQNAYREAAIRIDADQPPKVVVAAIVAALGL